MHDFLPLFPLKLVVFPGEQLNLHIFEPRYKQLIREADQNGVTFGIPAYINEKLMEVGTEIKLLSIENRNQDGSMDIITQGVGIFRIETFFQKSPNKLYPGADIKRMELDLEGSPDISAELLDKLGELYELLDINKTLPKEPKDVQTYLIAHHIGLSVEQEYQLLSIPSEFQRQAYVLDHLSKLLPTVREMHRLQAKVKMNGHFRNEIPPI